MKCEVSAKEQSTFGADLDHFNAPVGLLTLNKFVKQTLKKSWFLFPQF